MKRGDIITYKGSSFTDYMIRDNLFVVINGSQWIGMYNMDCVEWVAYIPEDKIEQLIGVAIGLLINQLIVKPIERAKNREECIQQGIAPKN